MIKHENRQKTKILKCTLVPKTYTQISSETGVKIDSIRGRICELRRKGFVEKLGEDTFKITNDGSKYLTSGNKDEV